MQVARKKARNKNLLKAARTLINKQLSNHEDFQRAIEQSGFAEEDATHACMQAQTIKQNHSAIADE